MSFNKSANRVFDVMGAAPVFLILAVSAIGVGFARLGPEPTVPLESRNLWPEQVSALLNEPRDRMILLGWWGATLLISGYLLWAARRAGRSDEFCSGQFSRPAFLLISSIAFALVLASITWTSDQFGYWPGVTVAMLIIGGLLAFGLFALWRLPKSRAVTVSTVVFGLSLAFAGASLIQDVQHLRDPYHFTFTGDELSAVAAGRFPLVDYIPQYTNLLSYPIAPFMRLLPDQAGQIALIWILVLQLLTLAAVLALPLIVGGWRMLAPAALVLTAVICISSNAFSTKVTTYFAIMPLRLVLPILLLLATLLLLRRQSSGRRRLVVAFVLGLGGAVTAINNPDFGAPALLVVLVTLLLTSRGWNSLFSVAAAFVLGSVIPFLIYSLVFLAFGRHVDWTSLLFFQRIFGSEGFMQVAMSAFGLHIAVASLYASVCSIGLLLLVLARQRPESRIRLHGLLLFLVGSYSLLSLVYFAGRSLVPTLLGGTSVQAALVLVSTLPLLNIGIRSLGQQGAKSKVTAQIGVAFGFTAVAAGLSLLMLAQVPSNAIVWTAAGTSGDAQDLNSEILSALKSQSVSTEGLSQALTSPSLTQIETGILSASLFNSPAYFGLARAFTSTQCESRLPEGTDKLLISKEWGEYLLRDVSCLKAFDLANPRVILADSNEYWILTARSV